jgi:hypothetical protein
VDEIAKIIKKMGNNPKNVKFVDLCKICKYYFGEPRIIGSHRMYKTPWQGDSRINIQNDHGNAKAYQVKQILQAIEKLGD